MVSTWPEPECTKNDCYISFDSCRCRFAALHSVMCPSSLLAASFVPSSDGWVFIHCPAVTTGGLTDTECCYDA